MIDDTKCGLFVDCNSLFLKPSDSTCSTNHVTLNLLRSSASAMLTPESIDMHEVDSSESRKSWRERLRNLQMSYDEDEQGKILNKKTQDMNFQYVMSDCSGSITTLPGSHSCRERQSEYNSQAVVLGKSNARSSEESYINAPDVSWSSWNKNENCANSMHETTKTLKDNRHLALVGDSSSLIGQLNTIYDHNMATGSGPDKLTLSKLLKSTDICHMTYETPTVDDCSAEVFLTAVNRWGSDCIEELTSSLNISGMLENASDLDDSFWDPGSDSIDTEIDDAVGDCEVHQAAIVETILLRSSALSEPHQHSTVDCAEQKKELPAEKEVFEIGRAHV